MPKRSPEEIPGSFLLVTLDRPEHPRTGSQMCLASV